MASSERRPVAELLASIDERNAQRSTEFLTTHSTEAQEAESYSTTSVMAPPCPSADRRNSPRRATALGRGSDSEGAALLAGIELRNNRRNARWSGLAAAKP